MWRPVYNPRTKMWDVHTSDDGPEGFVASFELASEAEETCRAVNAARGFTEPRRAEWEAA